MKFVAFPCFGFVRTHFCGVLLSKCGTREFKECFERISRSYEWCLCVLFFLQFFVGKEKCKLLQL